MSPRLKPLRLRSFIDPVPRVSTHGCPHGGYRPFDVGAFDGRRQRGNRWANRVARRRLTRRVRRANRRAVRAIVGRMIREALGL